MAVQCARQPISFHRFSCAFQVSHNWIEHLITQSEPEFRVNVIHNLLPSVLGKAHRFQGYPAALHLPERIAKRKQKRANAGRCSCGTDTRFWTLVFLFLMFFLQGGA